MLGLLTWFFEKFDPLRVEEFIRSRNNRSIASNLFHILILSYEIIDIYEILLKELAADLSDKTGKSDKKFWINPARFASLLAIQSDNLDRLSQISRDVYVELRLLDKDFKKIYDEIFSGKFGVLNTLSGHLAGARLPTNEFSRRIVKKPNEYRTLWFTWEAPTDDRSEIIKYLHGYNGSEKTVVDINNNDGIAFYEEIARYFEFEKPLEKLDQLKDISEKLRQRLESNFQLSDIISDIGKVARRRSWAPIEK